jgi:hypothetical protein
MKHDQFTLPFLDTTTVPNQTDKKPASLCKRRRAVFV